MSTWVSLEPLSATVDAGGRTAVVLRIRNTGDIVEEYHVDLVGEPALWATAEPSQLRLYPGTTGSVRLVFAPPRSPGAAAGPHPYGVRVRPVEVPDAVTVPEGNLTVTPFTDIRAELLPVTVRGWRRGRPRLVVDNYSNTTVTASVVAANPDSQIDFDLRQPSFQIPPGRASFSKLSLRPQRLLWLGRKVSHPYKTTVQPSGSAPVTTGGTYVQTALLPGWLGRLLMVAAGLAAAVIALWMLARPDVGSKAVAETASAPAAATHPATESAAPDASSAAPAPRPTTAAPKPAPGVTLPAPVGWWKLTGDSTADSAGDHPVSGSNTSWCGTGPFCATFNGTSSAFTTSGPVLDTGPGASFTVSAGTFLTAIPQNGAFATMVSQDGSQNSGFFLQYSGADKRWAFSRDASDTPNPPSERALSTSPPVLNTWATLVGVYNGQTGEMRLYVNGTLEGTATDSTAYATGGDLAIGRAQFDGQPTDWFPGALAGIRVWDRALTPAQVKLIK